MLPASRPLIACRHRFPAHPTFDWLYVFEDDVMLEPRFGQNYQPEDVLCYLSAAEKLATARGSPMIYLDASSATWRPQPSSKITCARSTNQSMHRHRHGVMEEGPLLDLSILPCAPICLHAYAIRRQDAADLYGKIRSHLERIGRFSKQFYGYSYYRYNLDVNVRGFFHEPRLDHTAVADLHQNEWTGLYRAQQFDRSERQYAEGCRMARWVGWRARQIRTPALPCPLELFPGRQEGP